MTAMGETVLCHYRYDPLDRLIGHTPSDTSERQRFYCKSKLATEIQGATRYSVVQHGDLLLAQQRNEGDATENTLLATDQQRSVLQTVKVNHPPQPIAYSPYGHRPIASGLLSLLGFNGERPDPVTGHYLLGNGYRAFNPVLMRFNSPDSLSPFGRGGLNPYVYCGQNPILIIDPDGHAPFALSTFLYKLNFISADSYKSKIFSEHIRLLNQSNRISNSNFSANMKLRNPVYVEDFKRARHHFPTHNPKQVRKLQDIAAGKLSDSQTSMLPSKIKNSGIVESNRNLESGKLFPLYQEIANTPSGVTPEGYTPWKLKNLMTQKTPLPNGISMEDVNNFHRRISSIRNPHHDQNKARINALWSKSWELKRQYRLM
jgi:RHS repeat-associated protein